MTVRQDDTLGMCGCVDYHYSDCPTYGYANSYESSFDIGDYYDNETNVIDPDPIAYEQCEHGNGSYLSEVAGFECDDCDSTFIGPLFEYVENNPRAYVWHSFFS